MCEAPCRAGRTSKEESSSKTVDDLESANNIRTTVDVKRKKRRSLIEGVHGATSYTIYWMEGGPRILRSVTRKILVIKFEVTCKTIRSIISRLAFLSGFPSHDCSPTVWHTKEALVTPYEDNATKFGLFYGWFPLAFSKKLAGSLFG